MTFVNKRITITLIALLLFGLLTFASGAFDADATLANGPAAHSQADVINPAGDVVGHSNLVRQSDRIIVQFKGDGLETGNVYTFWWLIFDPPHGGPPPVAVINAAGFIATKSNVNLNLKLDVGTTGTYDLADLTITDPPCCFGTFANPMGATIQLEILDHGSAADMTPELLAHALANPHYGDLGVGCSNIFPGPVSLACPMALRTIHTP